MKQFFKYLMIILLVLASIAGTCYFFYRHLTRRQDSQAYVSSYLFSSANVEFDGKVDDLIELTGSRFSNLETTRTNLEEILSTFNTYMISVKNHDVDENEIISRFDNYLALQNEVSNLIDSYINRVNNSDIFDPNTGANEIVVQFCNMNLALADTLMFINSELDNLEINKDADLKFSMIDLYLNIVLTTLDDTTLDINGLQVIRNEINLTTINNFFELENSIIITPSNTTNFESDNNNFILHYENVDKVNFAENFADNINRINVYSDNLSETEKAIYYFKAIYNLL